MTVPSRSTSYLNDALERIRGGDGGLQGPAGSIDGTEIADAAARAADVLVAAGCGAGRRVAVLTDCPASACGAILAIARVGAVPALMHRGWFTRDLDTALTLLAPAFVLADNRLSERIPSVTPLVFQTFSATGALFGETFPVTAPQAGATDIADHMFERPDPGLIVFSSGTTGTPSAFHHDDTSMRSAAAIAHDDAVGVKRALVTTDPSSSATLLTIVELMAAGATVELRPRWSAKSIREALTDAVDLVVATAPRVHGFVATAQSGSATSGVAGRRLISTGGPLMVSSESIGAVGLAAHVSSRFELAEVAGWATDRPLDPLVAQDPEASDVLRLGRSLAGIEITTDAPEDEVGPLLISGDRAATHGVRQGRLETLARSAIPTGDLAIRIDTPSGVAVRWMGRESDRFMCDGTPVFPAEQEAALAQHPAVADVAVVARPDLVHGSIGVAVTVPADPSDPPFLKALLDDLDALPTHGTPRAQWITNSLPLTPDGRIQRRLLAYEEMTRGPAPTL